MFALLATLLAVSLPAAAGGGVQVGGLTVNDRVNPLGIGAATRISAGSPRRAPWRRAERLRGAGRQRRGAADVWSSGKVTSASQVAVSYGGPALRAATRYHWQVRVWDGDGRGSAWSAPAWFETGLLGAAEWAGAEWLTDTDAARPGPTTRWTPNSG